METPWPGTNHNNPMIRHDKFRQWTGLETDLVNPPELRLYVGPDLSPVAVPGVQLQLGHHGVVGPVVQGPEPDQGHQQDWYQHGDCQDIVNNRIGVPKICNTWIVVIQNHRKVTVTQEVN